MRHRDGSELSSKCKKEIKISGSHQICYELDLGCQYFQVNHKAGLMRSLRHKCLVEAISQLRKVQSIVYQSLFLQH